MHPEGTSYRAPRVKFIVRLDLVPYSIKIVIKNKKNRSTFKTANLKRPPRHLSRLSGLEQNISIMARHQLNLKKVKQMSHKVGG